MEKGLRPDLLIGLVMFVDNEKPVKYLFSSTVWQTPNQLFTNSAVNHAEYGISVNRKTFADLAEYAFEKQVLNYWNQNYVKSNPDNYRIGVKLIFKILV